MWLLKTYNDHTKRLAPSQTCLKSLLRDSPTVWEWKPISALCGISLKHSWPGPLSTSSFLRAEAGWLWGYQVRHILTTPADMAGMPRHAPNNSSSSINTCYNLNNRHLVYCAVTRWRDKTTRRPKSFQTHPNLTYGVQSAMMLRVHQLGFQRIRFTQTRVFLLITKMNTLFRLKPWHGGYILDENDKKDGDVICRKDYKRG